MKILQAKFKVGSVVDYGNQNIEANLTAVTGDSPENKTCLFSLFSQKRRNSQVINFLLLFEINRNLALWQTKLLFQSNSN